MYKMFVALYESLQSDYGNEKVGLLHGKMTAEEKIKSCKIQ